MRKRRLEEGEGMTRIPSPRKEVSVTNPVMRSKTSEVEITSMINDLSEEILTEETIKQRLVEAVEENVNAGIGDDEEERGGKTKPKKTNAIGSRCTSLHFMKT